MQEKDKRFLTYSIWVGIVLFILRILISKQELVNCVANHNWISLACNFYSYAGEAIAALTIVMTVFNKWLWKLNLVNKMVNMPVLAKKYTGEIVSDSTKVKEPINATLLIKQTYLNISLELKTVESRSFSLLSAIELDDKRYRIVYTYQNEPRAELIKKSSIHKGTAELWIDDSGTLEGNYYTNRKTVGSMIFKPDT